jgi:hypothetical protein
MESIKEYLKKATPAQARALFEFDINTPPEKIYKKYKIWARYFFPKYFKSPDAPFHKDMAMHRIRIYVGRDDVFLNVAFRGSAKTTDAKLFRAFVICNDMARRRKYMRVLSKDIGNSRQSVTDIFNMLINKRIKALYPEIFEKTEAKRQESMSVFTTSTGVKVVAETIGMDQRGAVQEDARPDFDWYDDFETRLSLFSAVITHKIWANMQEAFTGLAKGGASEYTCNYISERGNVHKLVLKTDERYKMIVPIGQKKNLKWIPTWSRYSHDDIAKLEAEEEDFEGERLCKPAASKDVYFSREDVDKQMPKNVIDEVAGMKIFIKYRPENRIVGGHDVGGGVGLDSSTSVYLDLDVQPIQVLATYKNNMVKPDAFAVVISKQGKKFGEAYEAVEKNYGSTNDMLKQIYPSAMIHKTQDLDPDIYYQKPREYGWETNFVTKEFMLSQLSKAVEDGLIELNDEDLIAEARSYTTGDLMDRQVDPRLTTRHFDLLMACAIAFAVRSKVPAREVKDSAWPFAGTNNEEVERKSNPAR